MTALPPGSTIGILGGGQLGRMLAVAAAQLGYRCHIYAPAGDNVAFDVAAQSSIGAYDDHAALKDFAQQCDVVTFEFENVPVAPLETIAGLAPIYPPAKALEVAQDRDAEKRFVRSLGGQTASPLPSYPMRIVFRMHGIPTASTAACTSPCTFAMAKFAVCPPRLRTKRFSASRSCATSNALAGG